MIDKYVNNLGFSMRIYEIINTTYSTKEIPKFDLDAAEKEKAKHLNNLDPDKTIGSFAKVDLSDPYTAKKSNFIPTRELEDDAYYVYAKTIADNNLAQSNPYFPRVYKINKEIEKGGKKLKRPSFEMEKLQNNTKFDNNVLRQLGKKMFIDFKEHNYGPQEYDTILLMTDLMKNALETEDFSNIKDPLLKQALNTISQIISTNDDFFEDLSSENWMIRSTAVGPQVVLSDPIGNFESTQYDNSEDFDEN